MVLHRFHSNNITVIQNRFIDEYMVSANGEFVKVYLYLLRCSSSEMEISLSSIADALCHTENDVRRALNYWEKLNLLHLSYDAEGYLTDLAFTEASQMGERSKERVGQYAATLSAKEEPVRVAPQKKADAEPKIQVSAARKKELTDNEEIAQLLFVAEQYLGKQLSTTEVEHLLYFYDELHLSSDVIEYLIEYCVSRNIKSIHYIKKVAFEWAAKGVKTVQDAKKDSNAYHKEYYTILKAFGIHNRGPADAEITFMEEWLNTLGYDMEMILEAVKRTITRIHTPSFPYADTILQDWNKKGIRNLKELSEADKNSELPSRKSSAARGSNHTENFGFEPRKYDFQKLEEQLLDS